MFGTLHHPRPVSGHPLRDVANVARRLYRREKVDEALARLEADAREGFRVPGVRRMPNPGKTAMFGELLEVHTADVDDGGQLTGDVRIVKWSRGKGPPMLWSPKLDAVVAFPGNPIDPPMIELDDDDDDCVEAYRTWTRGREPLGKSVMRQPDPPMRCYGQAICTLYASDKFSDRGRQWTRPFLHHHDQGVLLWVSDERSQRQITAIMVRGGDLRVTEDGLAG